MSKRRASRARKAKQTKTAPLPDIIDAEVDNPRYEPGHPVELKKVSVKRSIRNDVLEKLRVTKRLSETEYLVAREMQALFEAAEIGHVRSADPTREPVDGGGGVREPINDRQQRAAKRLAELQGERWGIGRDGMQIVRCVCAEGMMPEDVARAWGYSTERQIAFVGQYLRRMLNLLAVPLGYESVARTA